MKKILLILFAAAFILPIVGAQERIPALNNAKAIRAGGEKGLAPMSFPMCYSNKPRGTAYISSKVYPDIFVFAPRGFPEHTGIYLCEFDYVTTEGDLVYKEPYLVGHDFSERLPPDRFRIFQDKKKIYGIWIEKGDLIVTEFDVRNKRFISKRAHQIGKINNLIAFDIYRVSPKKMELVILRSDGKSYRPQTFKGDTQSYYDGAGIYRGDLPRSGVFRMELDAATFKPTGSMQQLSADMNVMTNATDISYLRSSNELLDGYVISSGQGSLKYIPRETGESTVHHLRNKDSDVITHPTHSAVMASFSTGGGTPDKIIIGGEGAVYFYDFAGITPTGAPAFTRPQVVLQENAELYAGSLTVPNVVDWNGDGTLDIVAGNSEGRLLFFENRGTDAEPDFMTGTEIESGGVPICFRPGYNIVQGPFEGAWGYLCPTVFDWNGDGLPDVVFSGSRAKFEVMLNSGTKTQPHLEAPFPLMLDNMELHGTWRVKPAIAEINGRVAMVILDDDNALHLYWKVDERNVEDGGKLLLTNGSAITGDNDNQESRGQWGRGKLSLADWDGDGNLDILIGSIKRSSYPAPSRGLPWSRVKHDMPGMQVMLVRNAGTNENMVFEEPVQFQVDGKDFYLGAHSNAPFACALGDTSEGLNLVVGVESGKFFFFDRKHLTTVGIPD